MGASLSGNCNFAEMLDNLCGGESSAKTIRGPSYSGNLPNLIVLGGIFVILFPFFFSFVFAASLSDLEFIRSMRETGERVE